MKERFTVNSRSGLKLLKGKKYVELLADKELTKKALNRLAEYEDAEEQGLLVRLPCKVGDTFYCIRYARIIENQVSEISTDGKEFGVYDLNGEWYHTDEITFMQAEAEKKLEELKEKNND